MKKIIKIENSSFDYIIRKKGFYFIVDLVKFHGDIPDYWGLGYGFSDQYKTERGAMNAIKRHAEKSGYVIQ